jgi:Virulence factor
MAEYQVTRWHAIPALVSARDGVDHVKVSLPDRFQEAIDEAAMRGGLAASDAYLEGWQRDQWTPMDGSPAAVAAAVAEQVQHDYPPQRLASIVASFGPDA